MNLHRCIRLIPILLVACAINKAYRRSTRCHNLFYMVYIILSWLTSTTESTHVNCHIVPSAAWARSTCSNKICDLTKIGSRQLDRALVGLMNTALTALYITCHSYALQHHKRVRGPVAQGEGGGWGGLDSLCMISDILLESNKLLHDSISLALEPGMLALCLFVTTTTAFAVFILIQLGIQQYTKLLFQHKSLCSSAGSTAL